MSGQAASRWGCPSGACRAEASPVAHPGRGVRHHGRFALRRVGRSVTGARYVADAALRSLGLLVSGERGREVSQVPATPPIEYAGPRTEDEWLAAFAHAGVHPPGLPTQPQHQLTDLVWGARSPRLPGSYPHRTHLPPYPLSTDGREQAPCNPLWWVRQILRLRSRPVRAFGNISGMRLTKHAPRVLTHIGPA